MKKTCLQKSWWYARRTVKKLTDPAEIVEVLGGPDEVAILTHAKNVKVVWNWYGYFGAFPPNVYKVMTDRLRKLGYTAPPYLWKGFNKPAAKRAA